MPAPSMVYALEDKQQSSVVAVAGPYDDVKIGHDYGDRLIGGLGNDTLSGLGGPDDLRGGSGDDSISGGEYFDGLFGDAGADTLSGDAGDDRIEGGHGDDLIYGGSGNDRIYAGSGVDTIYGGAGNDEIRITGNDDRVVEHAGGGDDTLYVGFDFSLADLPHIENLLTEYLRTSVRLTGNAAPNLIVSGEGDDTLDGGAGPDTLRGSSGNDTYFVDDPNDVVEEFGGIGWSSNEDVDTVFASTSFSLNNAESTLRHVEILILTGSGNTSGVGSAIANRIDGTSGRNLLDGGMGNDTLTGGSGADSLVGGAGTDLAVYAGSAAAVVLNLASGRGKGGDAAGDALIGIENLTGSVFDDLLVGDAQNNRLSGMAGNDRLIGGDGNDVLEGGVGADRLEGRAGNDRYVLDDPGDVVVESAGGGTDQVDSSFGYKLGANFEALRLVGNADISGTGNNGANTIIGNTGDNVLKGSAGDDTLLGGSGEDTLTGGAGRDSMDGGNGADTYYIDAQDDVVIDTGNRAADLDTVVASFSYTLHSSINRLILTGTADLTGTGNGILVGNAGDNRLTALDYGPSNSHLYGNDGDDTLEGSHICTLEGGVGDDTYLVTSPFSVLVEDFGAGLDTVVASDSNYFQLAANVENLILTFGASFATGTGIGNEDGNVIKGRAANNDFQGRSGNDTLFGDRGDDTLDGGFDNDVLSGGAGNDTFVIGQLSGDDRITDFTAGAGMGDVIDLQSNFYIDGFADLLARTTMVGRNSVIDLGEGDSLTLTGVAKASLVADDFLF